MKITVFGCLGRMGRELILEVNRTNSLHQAIVRDNHPYIGKKLSDIYLVDSEAILDHKVDKDTDVVIDFTSTKSSIALSKSLKQLNIPHVIGTTGFTNSELIDIKNIALDNKIFLSYNMSIGIHILKNLANLTAKILSDDYDIAISETHHKHKKDSPSGTALMLADEISKTNTDFKDKISLSSLRLANIIGDHNITFASSTEIINLSHKAQDRSIFAKGAIKAAEWLINQPNGFYNMNDMIKL